MPEPLWPARPEPVWPPTDEARAEVAAWERKHGISAERADSLARYSANDLPNGLTLEVIRQGSEAWGTLQRALARDRRQADLLKAERTEAFAEEIARASRIDDHPEA